MKKKILVKISWSIRKPLQMAAATRGIITLMTGNAKFTTPKVTLAVLAAAATRVETAWANRKNGPIAKDELIVSCNELDILLHSQADYVSDIADGDETIIHSAGFVSTGTNVNFAKFAAPEPAVAPVLKSLNGGVIKVKTTAVDNASNYCFILVVDGPINASILNGQINIDSSSKVYIINSSRSNVVFTGLPGLKTVSVAVVISNAHGDSGFSAVATGATLP
jgi:hypothetical protein